LDVSEVLHPVEFSNMFCLSDMWLHEFESHMNSKLFSSITWFVLL